MMPSGEELLRFLPEMILAVFATLIMLWESAYDEHDARPGMPLLALIGLALAAVASLVAGQAEGLAFHKMLVVDSFATYFRVLVIGIGALCVLVASPFLRQRKAEGGEFYSLMLLSILGQSVMVSANELMMVFIGLEISSIASYILAGYLRDDKRSNESALKYFLLGSFATGFLLYGVAWTYGLTGTTNFNQIAAVLGNSDIAPDPVFTAASAALILTGLCFKISAFPFQSWAPDVYQGAPTPVGAFLSAAPKAAAFATLLRVFFTAYEPLADHWLPLLGVVALLTMIIGNFAALWQTDIKRILGYSAIANAGYVLVAVAAHTSLGISAVLFYLAAYAIMNTGAFAVLSMRPETDLSDYNGLATRQPLTAALMSVFLASLIGLPLTAGFFGKFYIFKSAIDAELYWLAALGLLTSAVAAFYYLRIIVAMYMTPAAEDAPVLEAPATSLQAVLWISAVATIGFGIFPGWLLDWATRSSGLLR
ncbi:NADH-quinone oxidoreductase subunit N [Bryobacter aggregatus]|uniref:NADH-quinone oxidoreductase subunit N n=1 Tax=Bryobacter aggregatus TaxID=360054 RepID=UPI001EE34B8D|nr:NADH-quinone oxidoreductase subunit N [Bryobacter aggregatus]